MSDNRKRMPDGTIVNHDGSTVPPLDADLVARFEAAKDEHGVVRDDVISAEYFAAISEQSATITREYSERLRAKPAPQGSDDPSKSESGEALGENPGGEIVLPEESRPPRDDPGTVAAIS